jgi:hypothetical protein
VRALVIPTNTQTSARLHMRGSFGQVARAWTTRLTQEQRRAWNGAGPEVESAKRLLQAGRLTGQQLFQGLNSARARIGREMLLLPPARVSFGPHPVGQLTITNGEGGVRLVLSVTGPVLEDIMVFGQAPCSAGRSKRRNVAYLGLLPVAQGGLSDITELYVARYGEPKAGMKVFIVTRQQQDGWEGDDRETNEIVPEKAGAGLSAVHSPQSTVQSPRLEGACRPSRGTAFRVRRLRGTAQSPKGFPDCGLWTLDCGLTWAPCRAGFSARRRGWWW